MDDNKTAAVGEATPEAEVNQGSEVEKNGADVNAKVDSDYVWDSLAFTPDEKITLSDGTVMSWAEIEGRLKAPSTDTGSEDEESTEEGSEEAETGNAVKTAPVDESVKELILEKFYDKVETLKTKYDLVDAEEVRMEIAKIPNASFKLIEPVMQKLQKRNEQFLEKKTETYMKKKASAANTNFAAEGTNVSPPTGGPQKRLKSVEDYEALFRSVIKTGE